MYLQYCLYKSFYAQYNIIEHELISVVNVVHRLFRFDCYIVVAK